MNSPLTTAPPIVLPEVPMNRYTPKAPATGRVVRTERCTARAKAAGIVRHMDFDVSGTELEGALKPGQSFGIIPPGTDHRGKPHKVRLFSVASPSRGEDGEGKVVSTTVKRVIDEHWETHELFMGVCSNYLCDLQGGEEVALTGPAGKRFLLPENPTEYNYLFFSTGTGIAPFRAMAMDLLEAGASRPVYLMSGAPYTTDLLYDDLFRRYAEEYENFRYLPAASRQEQEDVKRPLRVQDRLETQRDELQPLLEDDRTLIYICGITGMELGIFQQLVAQLSSSSLEQYLQIQPEASDPGQWTRKMVNRQIKPTRRVFMEVYD